MDRLHAVTIALMVFLVGCDSKATADSPKKPSKGRVNAVVAQDKAVEGPSDFCDVYSTADKAKKVEFPPMDGALPAVDGWTWVNVWATWCKPCLEEMPRIQGWQSKLKPKGLGGVVFLSADESAEIVAKFLAEKPEMPTGPRLQDPASLEAWATALGSPAGAALPLHVFMDSEDRVRCIRGGGVGENDFDAIQNLIASP